MYLDNIWINRENNLNEKNTNVFDRIEKQLIQIEILVSSGKYF